MPFIMDQNIRVRVAPSPTGNLHIGTSRLALYNFLFAQKTGGKLILRIEDTDKLRSTKEFEKNITDNLEWLGINWDEFYRQSERTEVYKTYIQKMLDEGKAYISKEEPKEEIDEKTGKKIELRSEVIRFKNPNKVVSFTDLIHGEIKMDTTDLGDFVIAKSLDEPIFHLAVVIDDWEMKITHILRGDDHISNTPRHVLIQEAIGATTPLYAHLPMVLAPDKSKMSKRHGATSLTEYREKGYLKEALINFLALLGWNPGNDREIYSLPELVQEFSVERIQKSGAVFNIEKLNWFNREYILKLPEEVLLKEVIGRMRIPDATLAKKILPLVLDRTVLLSDINALRETGEFDFFFEKPKYDKELLYWKDVKDDTETADKLLQAKNLLVEVAEENWTAENIKNSLWNYAGEVGRGNVLWPLRVSLTGKQKSPEPFSVAEILGKSETLARIDDAVEKLK
jgi:glutamyl-tRNA synthetase